MSGLFLRGNRAKYINNTIAAPKKPDIFTPMPVMNDAPIPNSPTINNQSTREFPAIPLKSGAKVPTAANFKNPVVGDTPKSHDLSGVVAKPSPISLSKKAQRKMKPSVILSSDQIISNPLEVFMH